MRTFKDNAGRTWSVSVDCDAIRRVRSALKVNLVSTEFAKVLEQLLADPVLLCDVLYVICKPESEKQNVTDVDFCRAMAGDSIEHGTIALLEEIVNFTPNPKDRARVQRVLKALLQMAEESRDRADRKVDEELQKALSSVSPSKTSGRSSGRPPASSASGRGR